MKRMFKTIGIGTAAALGVITLAGQPILAESTGPGEPAPRIAHAETQTQGMGSAMMKNAGMAHMKKGGQGSGMMGHAADHCSADKDLSADDVRKIIEGRLAWQGNKRLKVGQVTSKDDDTYLVDIVTIDDSLVERLEMDRKTGATHRAE